MSEHSYPIGSRLLSIFGESDMGDIIGEQRFTGACAVGHVVSVDRVGDQDWSYGVIFQPSGVWVFVQTDDLRQGVHIWLKGQFYTVNFRVYQILSGSLQVFATSAQEAADLFHSDEYSHDRCDAELDLEVSDDSVVNILGPAGNEVLSEGRES